MKRLVVVVVIALALVVPAQAWAECAWVMWQEVNVQSFDKSGRQDPTRPSDWSIVLATSDERLCWKGVLEKPKQFASNLASHPRIPGLPGLTSTVDVGTNQVSTTDRLPDGTVIFTGITCWVCLPDTVDPRGPKGK